MSGDLRDRVSALSSLLVRQRRQLAQIALAIAETEDLIAETLEREALTFPHRADELRAKAQAARQFAVVERTAAARYQNPSHPDWAD